MQRSGWSAPFAVAWVSSANVRIVEHPASGGRWGYGTGHARVSFHASLPQSGERDEGPAQGPANFSPFIMSFLR